MPHKGALHMYPPACALGEADLGDKDARLDNVKTVLASFPRKLLSTSGRVEQDVRDSAGSMVRHELGGAAVGTSCLLAM